MHSAIGMWIVDYMYMGLLVYDWYRSAMFIAKLEQQRATPTTQVVQIEQQKEKQSEKSKKSENSQRCLLWKCSKVVDIFGRDIKIQIWDLLLQKMVYTISYLYADATHFTYCGSNHGNWSK